MIGSYGDAVSQVGNGTGDLQDSVVGAGAEVEIRHGILKKFVPLIGEAAVLP